MIHYLLIDGNGDVRVRGCCSYEDEVPTMDGCVVEIIEPTDARTPNPEPPYNYKRQRLAEYPTIGDQLDALWKALGPILEHPEAEAMLNKIMEVKSAHPKPTNKQ